MWALRNEQKEGNQQMKFKEVHSERNGVTEKMSWKLREEKLLRTKAWLAALNTGTGHII